MKRPVTPKILSFLFACSLFFSSATFAAANTITYTYDALDRVTFVQDNVNGNRDYDYDKVGNRLLVTTGLVNDDEAIPGSLAAPTGLSSFHVADCAYSAQWNAVPNATSYTVLDTSGASYITANLYQSINCPSGNPSANRPKSVRACNSNGCSAKAYF